MERQVDERVEELTKIKLELKRNEAIVVEQAQTIHNILAERDNLYSVIEKLTKEKVRIYNLSMTEYSIKSNKIVSYYYHIKNYSKIKNQRKNFLFTNLKL